jgi:hypothetical protein
MSPLSVGNPPRSRIHWEAALGDKEEAEDAGQSATEKAVEVVRTPPASPPSPQQESPGRELFPARQDPVLPKAIRAEQE